MSPMPLFRVILFCLVLSIVAMVVGGIRQTCMMENAPLPPPGLPLQEPQL